MRGSLHASCSWKRAPHPPGFAALRWATSPREERGEVTRNASRVLFENRIGIGAHTLSTSSWRRPGPIRRGARGERRWLTAFAQRPRPGVMGPGLRQDDTVCIGSVARGGAGIVSGVEAPLPQECNRLVDCNSMAGKSGMKGFDGDVIGHAIELGTRHRNPAVVGPRQDERGRDRINGAVSCHDPDRIIQGRQRLQHVVEIGRQL